MHDQHGQRLITYIRNHAPFLGWTEYMVEWLDYFVFCILNDGQLESIMSCFTESLSVVCFKNVRSEIFYNKYLGSYFLISTNNTNVK